MAKYPLDEQNNPMRKAGNSIANALLALPKRQTIQQAALSIPTVQGTLKNAVVGSANAIGGYGSDLMAGMTGAPAVTSTATQPKVNPTPSIAQPSAVTATPASTQPQIAAPSIEQQMADWRGGVQQRRDAIQTKKQGIASVVEDWKNTQPGQTINEYRNGAPGAVQSISVTPATGAYNPANVAQQNAQDEYWARQKAVQDAKYALNNYTYLTPQDKAGYQNTILGIMKGNQVANTELTKTGMQGENAIKQILAQSQADQPMNTARIGQLTASTGLAGAQTDQAKQQTKQSGDTYAQRNTILQELQDAIAKGDTKTAKAKQNALLAMGGKEPQDNSAQVMAAYGHYLKAFNDSMDPNKGNPLAPNEFASAFTQTTQGNGVSEKQKAEALAWAKANPKDPRAAQILAKLGV